MFGDDITVKFTALESAIVSDFKIPSRQDDALNVGLDVGLEKGVVEMIANNSRITMEKMASTLNVTRRT